MLAEAVMVATNGGSGRMWLELKVVVTVMVIRNGGDVSLEEEAGRQAEVLFVVVLEGMLFYPLRFKVG